MNKDVFVVKAGGEKERFDETKLRRSLLHAGATPDAVEGVVRHVQEELEDGMTTYHIYQHAYSMLRRLKHPRAMSRYSLRRAIADLGPTGFPFEKYIGEIFRRRGFEVALNQIVQGNCVEHEMDVVAWNTAKLIMIEAKFHHEQREKSDLKVALYIKARFDDLSEKMFEYGSKRQLDEGWLVTNTKFTDRAIRYGKCAGLTMVGWNYPNPGNLQDLIEDAQLHPITCLSSLSNRSRQLLLDNGVVLCRRLIEDPSGLSKLGVKVSEAHAALDEAKQVCSI